MEPKLDSTDVDEKIDDGNDNKLTLKDSLTPASALAVITDNSITGPAGSFAEVSYSEQISIDDPESSSTDISVNVSPQKTTEASAQTNLHDNSIDAVSGAASTCSPCSVEKVQPKPLCAVLPSTVEACTVYEVSQTFTTISRSPQSVKTITINAEPDGDDLCAAILLACLFCHPLDCLLATMRGCNQCVWSLCSSLCGCEPTTLQPLLDIVHRCDVCGCLGVRCFLCDFPACDICIQTTECLDLAMEISQMLYH